MSTLSVAGSGFDRAVTLANGFKIPMFGLGFFRGEPEKSVQATVASLQHGYRLLDTAVLYGNEQNVGEGIKQSGINREEIFVVTKVNPYAKFHGYEQAIKGVKTSLESLGTGYIDLMLIHAPYPGKILGTYDGLLKMKDEGLVRSVGVSNFGVHHLEELRKAGRPTPTVNQIELNCYCRKEDIVKYCHQHDIAVMGYSPLFRFQKANEPILVKMAERYKKTVAQIMIRWSFQKDYITIPKSSNPERIKENADIFDFVISDEDMKELESLPYDRCAFGPNDPTESPWQP